MADACKLATTAGWSQTGSLTFLYAITVSGATSLYNGGLLVAYLAPITATTHYFVTEYGYSRNDVVTNLGVTRNGANVVQWHFKYMSKIAYDQAVGYQGQRTVTTRTPTSDTAANYNVFLSVDNYDKTQLFFQNNVRWIEDVVWTLQIVSSA